MVGFLDELSSGVAVVGAPAVERDYGLDHATYTLFVFAAPTLVAGLAESALALASDRVSRRVFLVGGMLALSLSLAASALSPWPLVFSLGLAVASTASGCACGAAQASLVEENPGSPERAMARWSFFGALGDVATPPLVAFALTVGRSFRGALLVVAALLAAHAWALSRAPARDRPDEGEESDVPLLEALRRASRHGALWAWLFGAAMCTLLDEIVVALAALRMRSDLGASEAGAAAWTATVSAGVALGALATDRLLTRVSPRALLASSALGSVLALAAVLAAPSIVWLAPSLFVLGLAAAPQYAIAKARAYSALPGSPGVVNALYGVFAVLDVAAPLTIGFVAARRGIGPALACLLLQPLTLFALACAWPQGRNRGGGGQS
jgi:MFS family permease